MTEQAPMTGQPSTASVALALARTLNYREDAAITALSEIGAALLNPEGIAPGLPSVVRAEVCFAGYDGTGRVTRTLFYGPGRQLVTGDIAALILEAPLPPGSGSGTAGAIGPLLDGITLTLLQLRHPDWTEDEGSTGWAEFRWSRRPDGTVTTKIAGVIDYRVIETSSEEFWSGEEAA